MKVLKEADKTIRSRAKHYGPVEENWDNIARLWSAYLDIKITSEDVGVLNILQKVARCKEDNKLFDNYVDIAGYSALIGDIVEKAKR